ncbi:DUF1016 N-terminal domain-containing protein [Niabella terrae]
MQNELPGLGGFLNGNLKKMRVFAEFWTKHLKVGSAVPNQLPDNFANVFFSIGFTHHFSIASKCETLDEAWFYLQKTFTERWDYRLLEKQLKPIFSKNKVHYLTTSTLPYPKATGKSFTSLQR